MPLCEKDLPGIWRAVEYKVPALVKGMRSVVPCRAAVAVATSERTSERANERASGTQCVQWERTHLVL